MAKVVIFGTGKTAELAHFYLSNDSEHEVVAFTVDHEYKELNHFYDLPVIAYEEVDERYPPSRYKMFIPITYTQVNRLRAGKFLEAKRKGYSFVTYINSKATYYNTPVGENCFIFEDNIIQPFTKIGDNCILWSGNHIGHHSTIEDHCFLAPYVAVAGCVTIGEYSFIGINATIRDGVNIGKENVIGAGSLILGNTEDRAVFSPKRTEKGRFPSNRLKNI